MMVALLLVSFVDVAYGTRNYWEEYLLEQEEEKTRTAGSQYSSPQQVYQNYGPY